MRILKQMSVVTRENKIKNVYICFNNNKNEKKMF